MNAHSALGADLGPHCTGTATGARAYCGGHGAQGMGGGGAHCGIGAYCGGGAHCGMGGRYWGGGYGCAQCPGMGIRTAAPQRTHVGALL